MTCSYVKSDDVFAQEVGDEMVILDLKAGLYFGLDAVGSRVWSLLINGTPLPKIVEKLLGEYEVQQNVLEADIGSLAHDLVQHGLLVPKQHADHART